MKTATKVLLILTSISAVILIIAGALISIIGMAINSSVVVTPGDAMGGAMLGIMGIFYIIVAVPVLIFAIISMKKLDQATCADDFPLWLKIVDLVMVNVIVGVLLLCMKDSDYN